MKYPHSDRFDRAAFVSALKHSGFDVGRIREMANLFNSEEKQKAADDRHPLKRIGQPPKVAAAALSLLGEAGSWVAGQILHVDGGMGALRTFK
jgi:NAD(P)-dependent dehydrogenase (short-subunit alcohol dehydrogenase family)